MDHTIIRSGNAQLYTEYRLKPSAETILFLHGGPGVPMDFGPLQDTLSTSYQLIYFHQRGTGLSPAVGASYSLDEYIADIEAVLQHFQITRVHLWGHSWGGLYAQLFARQKPHCVSSLFLVSPSPDCGTHWAICEKEVLAYHKSRCRWYQWLAMGLDSLGGLLGSDKAYQRLFKRVIENYQKDFNPYLCDDLEVTWVRAEAINKTRRQLLLAQPLEAFYPTQIPIALVYGEKDIYGESRNISIKRLVSAQRVTIKNAGHLAWLQNPPDFFAILKDFYRA